jgi:hypothetical protein
METPKQPLMLYVNDKICLPKPAAPGVFVPASPEAAAALDAKDAEIARLRAALEWIALRIPPYEPALVVMREGYMPDRSAREVAHDVIACARAALRKNC